MTRSRGSWLGALLLTLGCSAGGEAPLPARDEPLLATPAPPSPLLVRQDAAGREACAHGGARVRSGLDVNGDGVLDDAEVQQTSFVCYPAPADPARVESRVRVEPVPAGATCAEGGSAVLSGLDTDRDGTLDADEVLLREVVCREHLLTHLTPAGTACPGEGVRLDVGRDLDVDGALAPGEVVATQVTCSDVLTGNIVVRTAEELAALSSLRAVIGSLEFGNLPVDRVALPRLEAVTQDLGFNSQDQASSLSLPALSVVGGNFWVGSNPRLVEVDVTKLRWVGAQLAVGQNPRLTFTPAWSELVSVGALSLGGTARLTDMRPFPNLHWVRTQLVLANNSSLVDFSLTLRGEVGTLYVRDNPALRTLSIDIPDTESPLVLPAFGSVTVENNPALKTVFLGCAGVNEALFLFVNPALTDVTVTAGALKYVRIDDNARLTRLQFPRLWQISGVLSLKRTPLEQLLVTRPFWVRGYLELQQTRLTALTTQQISGVGVNALISGNPLLTSLELGHVQGDLTVGANESLTSLTIRDSEIIQGSLFVASNPLLDAFSGPGLKELRGSFFLHAPRLKRVELPDLRWVHQDVLVQGPALEDTGLESLEVVGRQLRVVSTAMTRWKGLGALRYVGDSLSVDQNPQLQEVRLPKLGSVNRLDLHHNPLLARLALPVLHLAERAEVVSNASLPVCEVNRLFTQLPSGVGVQSGNDATGTCTPP